MTKHVKDVAFSNAIDDVTLAGTLTLPDKKGPFPAALLVPGVGPNDRDYTMLGHKLFLVLSDYLTRAGIAVLRVDKRGVGKSTGRFDTSVTSQDLARDVLASLAYLKTRQEIDEYKIGLIGHSEGGLIAAMVASQSTEVAFMVMMAGVVTMAIEHVLVQVAMQLKADGASEDLIAHDASLRKKLLVIVQQEPDAQKAALYMREIMADYFNQLPEKLKTESERFVFAIKESQAEAIISFFNSPSYRYWLGYDPAQALRCVKVPVLAINGTLDFVTMATIQLPIIRQALEVAGNDDFTIVDMPHVNHWLQTCVSGSIAEYGALKETIAPGALQMMADWINVRFGNKI